MGHYEKLYRNIRNNPKNVRFDDLEKLLTKKGGFTSRPGKGDHYSFEHPDIEEIISVDTNGKRKPLKAIYVKKCIQLFDELNPNFLGKED